MGSGPLKETDSERSEARSGGVRLIINIWGPDDNEVLLKPPAARGNA